MAETTINNAVPNTIYYQYVDQEGTHTLSRAQLLEEYYEFWTAAMKRVGKHNLISEDNCIEDFIVINWAYRVFLDPDKHWSLYVEPKR